MALTSLEEVMKGCHDVHGFVIPKEHEELYKAFITEQITKLPKTSKFKQLYEALVIDKTIMLGYLARHCSVETPENYGSTLIDSEDKLAMLRARPLNAWPDTLLESLFRRRMRTQSKRGFPTYMSLINEIGKHKYIVELWGRSIVYENDMQGPGRPRRPKRFAAIHERTTKLFNL